RGPRSRNRSFATLALRDHGEGLFGLVERPRRYVATHKAGERRDIGWIVGKDPGKQIGGARRIALRERRFGGLQQILVFRADAALRQALAEGRDLRFRKRAQEAISGLAGHECNDGRDRLNPHLARDRRGLVDIHLDELEFAFGGTDNLFKDWSELFAGPAPRGPKVDQHRLSPRLLDHVLHERLGRRVLNRGVGGGRRSTVLQHRVRSYRFPNGPAARNARGLNGDAPADCNLNFLEVPAAPAALLARFGRRQARAVISRQIPARSGVCDRLPPESATGLLGKSWSSSC